MSAKKIQGRVLVVAGSDSGGGAGVQADIKTITMLGGYAATAITALTAQNTTGVSDIYAPPPAFVERQMRMVLEDIGADCIKTGMLHQRGVIEVLAHVLQDYAHIPLVLDPVMLAKGGAPLLQEDAVALLVERLVPRAAIITPNLPEAAALTGMDEVTVYKEREKVAERLLSMGAGSVLIKGGHATGDELVDMLVQPPVAEGEGNRISTWAVPRLQTRHTHGTGCTLASAIATGVAQGMVLEAAVARAHAYVQQAIQHAPGLGKGHGPLNHSVILP